MRKLSKSEILERVKSLSLPLGEYVICGGAVLAAHGIRETDDIDMIVSQRVYDSLKQAGWAEKIRSDSDRSHILLKDTFDVSTVWSVNTYRPDPQQLIKSADMIDGIPFVQLDEVIKWKKACGREKDLRDLDLISQFKRNGF